MVSDGERLKSLLEKAEKRVLLCAPFVKAKVLRAVLSVVATSVPVRIVTRWRAAEIAAGVSDLEVLQVTNERPNTELALLDDLHAKLYLADDQCLVGSANLTGTALGWSSHSNIEILVPVKPTESNVSFLLQRLVMAIPVTPEIYSEVEGAVVDMRSITLDEAQDMTGNDKSRSLAWLPCCAAPNKLYDMYINIETTVVVASTKEDGLSDLRDLHIPPGLPPTDFQSAVRNTLLFMPAFGRIIDDVPQGLSDARGIAYVEESRPDLVPQDAQKQWRIVRDWIGVFFHDQFEIAPESFITRLRSRR